MMEACFERSADTDAFSEWKRRAINVLLKGDHTSDVMGAACQMPLFIKDVVVGAPALEAVTAPSVPRFVQNFRRTCGAKRLAVAATPSNIMTAEQKVLRFIRLVNHLGKAPWASRSFGPNHLIMNRLIASHLKLVVGDSSDQLHPRLYSLIDSRRATELSNAKNLVWVTNRQQGKTTTLGKFIAAITLAASLTGGVLCCVYSTKQDRAAELTKAAKDYLYWMQTPEGKHPDWKDVTLVRDNERMFACKVNGGVEQVVMARPKNPDTCRGDAFRVGIFDEAAFTSPSFWYTFALPLLQIRDRIFTCCTTPAPPRGFFDIFCTGVLEANARGDNFFELINHSLSCAECIENNHGRQCCHRLYNIPPWKPILALSSISSLMPKNRAKDYAAEVFGVMKETFQAYLPRKLLDAVFNQRERVKHSIFPPKHSATVWVSIDPASHGKSDMGLSAIVGYDGKVVIIGLGNINASRCQVLQLQAAVREFLKQVRRHPWLTPLSRIVPIIECNNNEVMAMSLVNVFDEFQPVWQPFTSGNFSKFITPGVGVWTSEDSKLAGLQVVYQHLLEGRIFVAKHLTIVDNSSFDHRFKPLDPESLVNECFEQLCQFTDDENGKVTGKTADGKNDDIGFSVIQNIYWRLCVMNRDSSVV